MHSRFGGGGWGRDHTFDYKIVTIIIDCLISRPKNELLCNLGPFLGQNELFQRFPHHILCPTGPMKEKLIFWENFYSQSSCPQGNILACVEQTKKETNNEQ